MAARQEVSRPAPTTHTAKEVNVESVLESIAPASPRAQTAKPLRILLVDDSALTRNFTAKVLASLDCAETPLQVDTAECGEDALDMTLDKPYDLILLDVEMPGLGGLKTCEMMKQRRVGARIAMLSGLTSAKAHNEGHRAGCDNYLTKPVNASDLRSILSLVNLRKASAA